MRRVQDMQNKTVFPNAQGRAGDDGDSMPVFLPKTDREVPLRREVLVMVMRKHQRYFPVVDAGDAGRLLPHFVTVANGRHRPAHRHRGFVRALHDCNFAGHRTGIGT